MTLSGAPVCVSFTSGRDRAWRPERRPAVPLPMGDKKVQRGEWAPFLACRDGARRAVPLLVIFLMIGWGGAATASAGEMRRFGLFVGQNDGGEGTHRLLYAEMDAERVHDLLVRHGSIEARDARLLSDINAKRVINVIAELGEAIGAHREAGGRAMFYFYYSGHADQNGLRLGATQLGLQELKEALRATRADLRIVLLDACQSGQATRSKGGTRAPSFLVEVDKGEHLEGEVIVTSSAWDESSQESDVVGGGYFTHHLVAGLLGAADTSRDGQVTLDEAYSYAYHRTLFQTAGSAGGLQHPGYATDLRGHGALVLTYPNQGQTILIFPSELEGDFLVFDRDRKLFVADLELNGEEERRLSLPAGRYLIQKRTPDHLLTTEVHLTRGVARQVEERQMISTGFEEDFSRGVREANIRRATRAPVFVSGIAGIQHFMLQPPGAVLFADTPLLGFEIEWRELIGPNWSVTADVSSGATEALLQFDLYNIRSNYWELNGGVGLKYGHTLGPFQVSGGPRLGGMYIGRSFPGTDQQYQDSFTITPGLTAGVSWELSSRVSIGLLGRLHFLYYVVADEDRSLGYAEGLARVSMRF